MAAEQCPDSRPHGPHTWNKQDGKGRQVIAHCPGVEKRDDDNGNGRSGKREKR